MSTKRNTYASAVLGPELAEKLPQTKVLLVGAGGIGCELLKNIVLIGFGQITLLDLDTIDLSNLNRQFLFRKKDVKQSKALVAAKTAASFNPNVHIKPIHGNIKEPQFDVQWFQGFDLVLNALDNLDARRHVNKMCMAAGVPLVESGTAGYLGQVQPLLKQDRMECFDCLPKPTPKTFPVCTIRSTPSQPIHCIVWSKSYLLSQLFGEDEDSGELDEALKQGENATEIATLRKEAQAFKAVRLALRTPSANSADAAKMAFQKVFNSDIKNLLSMADMWKHRSPPTPLDFDAILSGSAANGNANGADASRSSSNGQSNGAGTSVSGLKDQQRLSLKDNVELFVASSERLAARLRAGEDTISFDKDDDDTLDFVTAASNLRSDAYGIEQKTRWEVKEMAGNIIPAIATTNAIISGLIVLQALHFLRKSYDQLRNVHIQQKPAVPLSSIALSLPNPMCGVCRDVYTVVQCDPERVTLSELVQGIIGAGGEGEGREVSVYEDKRVLSDPDFDDNNDRTLASLNVTRGKFLNIVDEDGDVATIAVAICQLPSVLLIECIADLITPLTPHRSYYPPPLPVPPKKAKPPVVPVTPPRRPLKRAAPDDDDVEPSSKRTKTEVNGHAKVGRAPSPLASPNKRRRLEEDGLVIMEHAEEALDDNVIELD
ncbi:hypothetical protein ONZ45_g9959 [Pleurotus djamor]|nr:hypothetical protein ONZ45_g9959 [Pleurotus djamor]